MSVRYTRERIRLNISVESQEDALDAITGDTPSMWRGTDLAIEFCLTFQGALLDLTAFSSITAEVRDTATRTSQVLATKTIPFSDLNPEMTIDEWTAATSQHGVFAWTADQARWDLLGEKERDFWLVIHAITTDSPPRKVTLGGTTLRVVEDGAGEPANSPQPFDPLYLTAEQTVAAIGQVIRPGNNPPGSTITLVSPNGQKGVIIGIQNDGTFFTNTIDLA